MASQFQSPFFRYLFVATGLLALAWIAGEANFHFGKPDEAKRDVLIEQALEGARKTFGEKEKQLVRDTDRLVNAIRPVLDAQNPEKVYNRIASISGFWGISVFKNHGLYVWSGSPATIIPNMNADSLYVTLIQSGHVLYFVCQQTLTDELGNRFDIVATRLLRRSGVSPVLLTEQIDITERWASSQVYPVSYRFFDLEAYPLPAFQVPLHTSSVDSVGFVAASTADFPTLERNWHRKKVSFRYWILFGGMNLVLLFFLGLSFRLQAGWRPFSVAFIFGTFWIISEWTHVPFHRLLPVDASNDLLLLSHFIRDSVFISALVLCSVYWLKTLTIKSIGKLGAWLPNITALLAGIFFALICYSIHDVILSTETGLLSLRVNPEANTWIIYLAALLMFGAFINLVFRLARLTREYGKQSPFHTILPLLLFVSGTILMDQYLQTEIGTSLWFRLILIVLIVAVLSWFSTSGWFNTGFMSEPRLISLGVLCVVAISIPLFFDAEIYKEDQEMLRMSINYSETNEDQAEEILRTLLKNLSEDPGIQQIQTVDAYPSFPIQAAAQFRRRVNQLIEPEWNSYTILAFLLDGRLNVITDYGSQPAFSDRFSSSFYEEVRLFIRQSLMKPFARLPIVESDPRFKGFPVFVKGLQSIPSDFPSQPSWLVTFVLVEGTSFGRPVHDALSFHQRDRDNWNRFILTEYVDGHKSRTTAAARAPVYPVHHTLTDMHMVENGSRIRFERISQPTAVRQLIYRHDDRTYIIATVRDKTILNLIFSGFRFFVSILIISLALHLLIRIGMSGYGRIAQKTRLRLHDRILDSYLLATLLFLVALAFVTEFIVSRQNLRIAEQELSRNLTLLENRIYQQEAGESDPGLLEIQDNDIVIYEDGRMLRTSAPEIFRLQLLSEYMPYKAYDSIYNDKISTTFQQANIGGLPVLMGFRALFENQRVSRVIAIPAYTRSAAYEEEFLQTTSYLIAFYIIIFMFFTGAAWVVSRKLTQPLSEFQSGLKKISSGNLDTTIPVTSNDEIGELAQAYNQMVNDLKKVRQELAEAERDAAWTEMARQIAHEIKNPLTPMKLSIQHLQMQIASGNKSMDELRPNIEKLTSLLVAQIESLNQISSDFSRFAKPLPGVFEHVDLTELIPGTVQLFDHQDNVSFELDLPSEPVQAYVISDEIRRVLINLIKNGIEASDGVASITLKLQAGQGLAHIFVMDAGSGISEENADRIFTPNFSTKTSGTGLGLAICKKIMDAHKGSIQFDSSLNGGTTFEVILPLKPGSN